MPALEESETAGSGQVHGRARTHGGWGFASTPGVLHAGAGSRRGPQLSEQERRWDATWREAVPRFHHAPQRSFEQALLIVALGQRRNSGGTDFVDRKG